MRLAIVNTSIRDENTTRLTVRAREEEAARRKWQTSVVDVNMFEILFTGHYLTPETTTGACRAMIETLLQVDAILFVVPTYYKSMPGGLKNFFDIVRWPELYDHKVLLFVASNHKNQDYGAEQAFTTVRGILKFFDTIAVLVHDFPIINPNAIDRTEVARAIELLERYGVMVHIGEN